MSDEIDVGFDCCLDWANPTRPPRIYPRKITMNAGENINLYLKTVHPSCFKACFTWRVVFGGGYVDPEFGIETYYHAPPENEICEQSPLVEARCHTHRLGGVHIAINGYRESKLAYFDIGTWKTDKLHSQKVLEAMVGDVAAYKTLMPDFATVTIYHRDCSGNRIATTHADVFQIAGLDSQMKPNRLFGRWMGIQYFPDGSHFTREVGPSYGSGKYETLRRLLARYVDWGLPTGEKVNEWFPFYATWAINVMPAAGSMADVRNLGMLREGCCSYDLIPEE